LIESKRIGIGKIDNGRRKEKRKEDNGKGIVLKEDDPKKKQMGKVRKRRGKPV